MCLESLFFCYFHFRLTFESIKELGNTSKNLFAVQLRDKGLEEGEEGCSTPKKKLTFDLTGGNNGKSQGKWEDANPFET
jgi:hypothetical protein